MLGELLSQNEGPCLDFKRDLAQEKAALLKLLKTVVAMANTLLLYPVKEADGHVLLGVESDPATGKPKPLGVKNPWWRTEEGLKDRLGDLMREYFDPPIDFEVQRLPESEVWAIRVHRPTVPVWAAKEAMEKGRTLFKKGDVLVRRVASTQQASHEDLERWQTQNLHLSIPSQPYATGALEKGCGFPV
ncbi:ATP-binding protein [Thermus sp.]|uniref:AlbA family DNA-binding domain-containing protein n=1 Tax=Thermus sp. TaxID=275 RepID=UPI002620C3A4|nr:ATP-binding protein [Thermus sp.]MCX7850443.1 ATP-binding protein [Thermus sp.]